MSVNKLKVLMVGSHTNVKGGMTTVVESFLEYEFSRPIKVDYIATHTEKGKGYNIVFFIINLMRILIHLAFIKPQIVHMHMSERGSFVRKYIIFKLAKFFGKKVIVHMHGAEFKEYYLASPPNTKARIFNFLKDVDKVIALGSNWEKIIRTIQPDADITILRNAVPLPITEKCQVKKAHFTILFLAVLIERKGIIDLIHAAKPVIEEARKENLNIYFDIAGDGELLRKAKQLVSSYGLTNNFRFHGWIGKKEKKKLLKDADLFVLPSYNEGLPMSILEAMSYGLPIISTTVGSIEEAVQDGVNGYLISPGDHYALADRLLAVINNSNLEKMKQASREIAAERFNSKTYFEQVENLYMNEAE